MSEQQPTPNNNHEPGDAKARSLAALRHDLGVRCDFLASRAGNAKDPLCAGAANVLMALGWSLKKNDDYAAVVLGMLNLQAQCLHESMVRLEMVEAAKRQQGIVAPTAADIGAATRSKVS